MTNSSNQNENMAEEKISIKEIHEKLWRCRDFELSHLWQRSIFLSAFLILCFTGYGGGYWCLCLKKTIPLNMLIY